MNSTSPHQETISRLKFIGSLRNGDKINVAGHHFVQQSGIATSISRTLIYPDNRANMIMFCQQTVNSSFEILAMYESMDLSQKKHLYTNLLEDLEQAIVGLSNLRYTYITDVKLACDMETLIQRITDRLPKKPEPLI